MSDTPRSDKAIVHAEYGGHCRPVVPIFIARQLEKEIMRLEKELNKRTNERDLYLEQLRERAGASIGWHRV